MGGPGSGRRPGGGKKFIKKYGMLVRHSVLGDVERLQKISKRKGNMNKNIKRGR